MIQVSGLRATYDMSRPIGQRLIELQIGDRPADNQKLYRVATNSFLAQGGDLYQTFLQVKQADSGKSLSDMVMEYLQKHREIQPPKMGRLIPTTNVIPQKKERAHPRVFRGSQKLHAVFRKWGWK